jgi:hypothetical protein
MRIKVALPSITRTKRTLSLYRSQLGNGAIVLYPGTPGKINGVEDMAQLAAEVFEYDYNCKFFEN